jgi:ribulose-phosphate 3-epimerase
MTVISDEYAQSMNDIVPALPPASWDELNTTLDQLHDSAPWFQIDVCDGIFVPTRSWPMNPNDRTHFAKLVRGDEGLPHWQDFNFEVDLMVHAPENQLSSWISVGVRRAVVHLESHHDWSLVKEAAGDALELGLGIDLDPPYEKLASYVPRVDYLQIMGIAKLGKQGTEPDERVYALLTKVRADFPDVTIQIDGGVKLENARRLLDAGADRLVVGSKIVKAEVPKDEYLKFKNV